MSCCGNNRLNNKYFVTYRTLLTLFKTGIYTSRSLACDNLFGMTKLFCEYSITCHTNLIFCTSCFISGSMAKSSYKFCVTNCTYLSSSTSCFCTCGMTECSYSCISCVITSCTSLVCLPTVSGTSCSLAYMTNLVMTKCSYMSIYIRVIAYRTSVGSITTALTSRSCYYTNVCMLNDCQSYFVIITTSTGVCLLTGSNTSSINSIGKFINVRAQRKLCAIAMITL